MAGQIGRPVDSTNDLTTGEAALCIAAAEALPDPAPATEEPPAEEYR